MLLSLERHLAERYTSASQKIRVLTEAWVGRQAYCPSCGQSLSQYANNEPVADFLCKACDENYELKSKRGMLGARIVDGAYRTMMERLQASTNPNLFLLNYDERRLDVLDFLVVPKHFFVPEMIEQRTPLSITARRAGWTGCNILLNGIPKTGKIFFVRGGVVIPKGDVLAEWRKTLFLRDPHSVSGRTWAIDIMKCIEQFGTAAFTLDKVYAFEPVLRRQHPENRFVKAKIRQQLQVLRDKGYLRFVTRGRYCLA